MLAAIIGFINFLSFGLSLLIIAKVVMSYFMDRYHPVRLAVDRIVEPILNPIRRVLPQTGILDFSPIVAILLINVLEYILVRVLISLAGT